MPTPSRFDPATRNPLDYAETRSGEWVHLCEPDPATINLWDISVSLSNQCRFNGHCSTFYSVAEHSVHVAELLELWGHSPKIRLIGLLHDAAEAYTGDCISPVKRLVPQFKVIEDGILAACYRAAGLIVTPEEWAQVAEADKQLLADESFDLMPSRGLTWGLRRIARTGYIPSPWSPPRARIEFMAAFCRQGQQLSETEPTWATLPSFSVTGGKL